MRLPKRQLVEHRGFAAVAALFVEAAEKTVFDVKLDKFDAASKIKVIKEVRGFTELGLKEAKGLVEKAPVVVKKGFSKEEGESPDSVLSSESSLKIPWTFDSGTEKMYLLKGKVNIYCDEQDDEPFQIAAGDLVEFPNAMQIVFETRDLVVSYSIPNTVSFLTYLLKSFANYIRPHEESICKRIVNLLVTCSDSVSIRKELLVALKHVLGTDFKRGLFPLIDTLLEERVLVGTGRACVETLRPLAYSLLAEIVHHVREKSQRLRAFGSVRSVQKNHHESHSELRAAC